jgi:hypothetical protein
MKMFSLKVKCLVVEPKKQGSSTSTSTKKSEFKVLRQMEIPDCKNCKYSMKENGLDVCKLFKYSNVFMRDGFTVVDGVYFNNQTNCFHYYVDTENSREDNSLCGYYGEYFQPKK